MELCHAFMDVEANFHQSFLNAGEIYVGVSYFLLSNYHFLSKLDTFDRPLFYEHFLKSTFSIQFFTGSTLTRLLMHRGGSSQCVCHSKIYI